MKVHDDTHSALKRLKSERRSKSIDEVVRELIRQSTGAPVDKVTAKGRSAELTSYVE